MHYKWSCSADTKEKQEEYQKEGEESTASNTILITDDTSIYAIDTECMNQKEK